METTIAIQWVTDLIRCESNVLTIGHVVDDSVDVDSNPDPVAPVHHVLELLLLTTAAVDAVVDGLVALPPGELGIGIHDVFVFIGRGDLYPSEPVRA